MPNVGKVVREGRDGGDLARAGESEGKESLPETGVVREGRDGGDLARAGESEGKESLPEPGESVTRKKDEFAELSGVEIKIGGEEGGEEGSAGRPSRRQLM